MALIFVCPLAADNVLHPSAPVLDRPTLTALGVQLPITGDDNFNATVSVRYRQTGTSAWIQALPLFRVHPESTVLYTVAPQFAGSIFNLRPATSYDIELHAIDPDGPVDQVYTLNATTRAVPGDPAAPRVVNVNSTAALSTALGSAQPGDIIQLADGIYSVGTIFFWGSGTAQNPIVIRGSSEEGTILDGGNCSSCNILEIYGSFVHIEQMTLQSAERAIRFFYPTQGNVVRHVHVKNTTLGIHGNDGQLDYYIADNILQGRLTWPTNYSTDNAAHANDDGIVVHGFGHVVCHNQISGYADALQINQNGSRAIDFYGNDILWAYDNGVELDGSEGNTRAFRNRFTNGWDMLSVQPILGGPAYMFRNIVVNSVDEQMKFHAINTSPPQEPNGVLSYNNTFVSPSVDLNLCTPNTSHHFWIENNLFVGPAALVNKAVMWCGPVDDGHFDYNGYWPDGGFSFNLPVSGGYAFFNWPNFAAMQSGGLETHGTLLSGLIFANGLIGPQNSAILMPPQDVTLASGSGATDRGTVLPNIDDGFTGNAPDLGALESGCPVPVYGPRPSGMDETNEPVGCGASTAPAVSVSISPQSATLSANQSQTFTATVSGTTDSRITWTMSPSTVGTLSNGTYTAPASIASSQTLTITATSVADPTKSAGASVTLTPTAPAGADLAVGKAASQSSTISGFGAADASLAADGNTDGNFWDHSVSHTNSEANAWWQIDLGSSAAISTIAIWNRTDCCSDRLGDYWVFVSDTPFAPTDTPATLQGRAGTWSRHQTTFPNPSTSIAVNAQGRYVRVQLSGAEYLSLAEVQIFGTAAATSPDLALGKTAAQSSTLTGYGAAAASQAVDGNTDGNFYDGSVSHTNQEAYAWWQVDLGSSAAVSSIVIWNRTDCCSTRLSDYWIFVSDTPFAPTDTPATLQGRAGTWSSHQTTSPNPSSTIAVNATGRYVRVQLSGTNYLSLAEVQVFGTATANLAIGKAAAQSSTLAGYGPAAASQAVDGNTDGNFYDASVTHTNLDANAWWQVDLGTSAAVGSVVIWNRTDCCSDRLNDYWMFVSDTPFAASDTPATLQGRPGTWSNHQTTVPNPSSKIAVNATGRYLRVQLSGTNYLSLAEVQVLGQ